jgi:iron complex outermembrane receptor protein
VRAFKLPNRQKISQSAELGISKKTFDWAKTIGRGMMKTLRVLVTWTVTQCLASWALAQEPAHSAGAPTAAANSELEEVIVTAEKSTSTIQNTPVGITALSGNDLAARGITSIEDVTHSVPGLSMRSAGPGQSEFEARGFASNGGSSLTVGLYLDEVPLSPLALSQSGKVVIDPSLYDLDRVEVLRGPQGTLYGASSMWGTMKLVPKQAVLDDFQAEVHGTDGGKEKESPIQHPIAHEDLYEPAPHHRPRLCV